jgi:Arc/MetJ-type ribon-helix-helix transcriptional regulator
MSIEITPEIEQLVHGIFATGQFATESDVVTAAVRLLHDRQQLLKDLEQGCRELDDGQRIDADVIFTELRNRAMELDGAGS